MAFQADVAELFTLEKQGVCVAWLYIANPQHFSLARCMLQRYELLTISCLDEGLLLLSRLDR